MGVPGEQDPVAEVLRSVGTGDRRVIDETYTLVYDELRELARRHVRGGKALESLNPTALVHAAYERILEQKKPCWRDREHFVAVASMVMRRLVLDHIRRRNRLKRGGGWRRLPLELACEEEAGADARAAALDEALTRLEREHPRPARVVGMRVFAALGMEEIAQTLGISLRSAEKDWQFARAWLKVQLDDVH